MLNKVKSASSGKKILIAVSSTGGHIYPGLAIAGELKKNGYDVFFVGKSGEIILKEGYRFYGLSAAGFPRGLSLKIIEFFVRFLYSVIQSIKILKKEKPDIVIGFGGFVSFPVVLVSRCFWIWGTPYRSIGAARTLSRKRAVIVIHEQNVIPGLANRFSARFSDKICVSFEESKKYFPAEKVVFTGNPVRRKILEVCRSSSLVSPQANLLGLRPSSLITCLIFGGSQGSHGINLAAVNSLESFSGIKEKIRFIHITGDSDYELIKNTYAEKGFTAEVHKYLHNIESAYQRATLVVCRAGATTVAELISLKLPAVLVPYPYSAEGHQKANADYLGRTGAAVVLEEKELKKLPEMILEFVNQPQTLLNMSQAYKKLPDSKPVQILSELIGKMGSEPVS